MDIMMFCTNFVKIELLFKLKKASEEVQS